MFDEQEVKCTFYACAVALERNRDAAKEMRGRGHDVMSHGYRWEDVSLLTREQEREHIRLAVASIAETTGERPLGWYCRYGPSVHTRELVVEEGGFLYDSDAYNDDLPYWTMVGAKKHLVIPYSLATNDGKFNWGAFGSPADFEKYLKANFDQLYKEGPDASQDDVDRPAHAPDRPSRAGAGACQLHRLRQVPSRCVVRPPDRHRAPLDGASRLISQAFTRARPYAEPIPQSGAVPGPVRDVVGYNGKPPKVTWPGGARIAISLVVNYEEGSELAVGDGDGLTERGLSESAVRPWPDGKRDLAMETMYEYGARVGFWRLMDIFDELEVKSTFYVCAIALERNRKAAREIRGRGPRRRVATAIAGRT